MLKIYIFFVLAVVAFLFVTGKHKFKIYCNTQFPQNCLEFLAMRLTGFCLPENLQTLKTSFLVSGNNSTMNCVHCLLDFLHEKYTMEMFEIYILLALFRLQCTWKRIQINYKNNYAIKYSFTSEMCSSSIEPVWKI
jgi:hypothetical protein